MQTANTINVTQVSIILARTEAVVFIVIRVSTLQVEK